MADLQQALIIRKEFYLKACRDDFQSEKQGKPVYVNMPYIRFLRADTSEWARPAWDMDYKRYKDEYKAFLLHKESTTTGVPIREMQGLTPAEVETLKELGIVTIEGLAQSTLSQMTEMGERFISLRQYAQTCLKTRQDMEEVYTLRQRVEAQELEILRLKGEGEKQQLVSEVGARPKVKAEDPVEQEVADDPFFAPATKRKPSAKSVDVRSRE